MSAENEEVEYLPWYQTGQQLVRCLGCGSLLAEGDAEPHTKWHNAVSLMSMELTDMQNRFNELIEIVKQGFTRAQAFEEKVSRTFVDLADVLDVLNERTGN